MAIYKDLIYLQILIYTYDIFELFYTILLNNENWSMYYWGFGYQRVQISNITPSLVASLLLFSFSKTLSATLFVLSATDLVFFEFVAYLDSLCGLNYLVV